MEGIDGQVIGVMALWQKRTISDYDVILHSRGMNYYLGQELSEQEVGGFWRAMQCMTDDTISDDAGIPWSIRLL